MALHLRGALLGATVLSLLAGAARADEPRPASVLVFPARHAEAARFTLVSVTNTSPSKSVTALYRWVSSDEAFISGNPARDCAELYRAESLTPNDTVTVLAACHTGSLAEHGYLVVAAKSAQTGQSVGHDFLIGSELVIDMNLGFGGFCSMLPAPFQAVPADGQPTDLDFDGQLDFDGIEYEQLPDDLYIDAFLGNGGSRLSLLNMSGERNAVVSVQLFVWNDAEKATSAQFTFQCWFERALTDISLVFSEGFLLSNTPNAPSEVDVDCDGVHDVESGWARISGISASGSFSATSNPPLLGGLAGGRNTLESGRLLWGSNARSSGSF